MSQTKSSESSIASLKQSPPLNDAEFDKLKPNIFIEEREEQSSDEEEEEDEEEAKEIEKIDSDDEGIRNIDGLNLGKPYYFQTILEKKDPVLIIKEDTPEYNGYSRTCLSSKRRQPVILTDSQLEKINKEHPGFLREEDVIKYGSDEKHQFNYICPRYWCLKSNTFINPEDVKLENGEYVHRPKKGPSCGKVLPKNEKKVKPGYYIYEFNDKSYPGLIPDRHPKGLCLPCCFKNYNTDGRIEAKKSCLDNNKVNKTNKKNADTIKDADYVLGPEKFPLSQNRWGYLPPEIQTILHEINADCQISKTNTNIKDNHPCLVRHGVEVNKNQSFIAAISDLLFFAKKVVDDDNRLSTKTAKVLSIDEMKERIIESISIDTFIKYQNGNLVANFKDDDRKVDVEKYKDTKLYSKINMSSSDEKSYFTKVLQSFENFLAFLRDDESIIDHRYLWDIISIPNKKLFPKGVNLVIFQLPNSDITNNVEILCPTNHYSNEFYQKRKPTIFLIKEDGYYEPIYSYTNIAKPGGNNRLVLANQFEEENPHLSKTMKAVFEKIIKPFFNLICRPLESMPNTYKVKQPLLLIPLIKKLEHYKYEIQKLIMNFNNKIIGVLAKDPKTDIEAVVPCYPSAYDDNVKENISFVFMTDFSIWNTYENTIKFLNNLSKRSRIKCTEPEIPCKPMFKIIEDELVVGILTNTNQFIQISEPIDPKDISSEYDLPSLKDNDYIVNANSKHMKSVDAVISSETKVDVEREDYVKRFKLETSFYNVFRNTVRILLNKYENVKIREKIEKLMFNQYIIYTEKIKNVDQLLRELVDDKIQFTGDENYYKVINQVSTCISKDSKCKDTPNLCVVSEKGDCNLILPERNLVTNKENQNVYFGRMADELVRYSRIKPFILQPQKYFSFGNIGYNLRDNEMIVVQSTFTQEYFESLIPSNINKYVNNNAYDETQPAISQVYNNRFESLDEVLGMNNVNDCEKTVNKYIKSSIWKKCFPNNYSEVEYSSNNSCTFNFIIDLIERKTNKKPTINEIKNVLVEEYSVYLEKFEEKITNILILEGKKTLGDQVKSGLLDFSTFIYSNDYFLTTLDLWMLVNKYKLPVVFISQTLIMLTKTKDKSSFIYKNEFLGYGNPSDSFAFIIIPGLRKSRVPNLKYVQSPIGEAFIPLNKLENDGRERITNAINNQITIEQFLETFIMPSKTEYEKKLSVLDSDSEDELEEKIPIRRERNIVSGGTKKRIRSCKKKTRKSILQNVKCQNKK